MVYNPLLYSLALSSIASAHSFSSSTSSLYPTTTIAPLVTACRAKNTITATVTVDAEDGVSTLKTFEPYTIKPWGGPAAAQYSGPAQLKPGSDLKPGLSQEQQNGDCSLGVPDAPRYSGPIPDPTGAPWGSSPPWHGNPPLPRCYHDHGHCSPPDGGPGPIESGKPTKSVPSSFATYTRSSKSSSYASWTTKTKPSSTKTWSMPSSSATGDCVLVDPAKVPDTGKTRKYHFDVSYRNIAPDGVLKQALVINGGFPGPTIEANWGDWIEVTVKNSLDNGGNPEGTTIHWHGLLQKETPFMDGVPSVTQCPIIPGDSFTYKFRADQYGSTWYHSHYSAQYSGGVYGAIIIHGPNDTPECAGYDEDLGPVLVGDWYHPAYYDLVNATMSTTTGLPPFSNNNLVNGKANYPCANTTLSCTPDAGLTKFKFTSGKKYRMRLINPSSDAMQKISIDGHKFTVIAYDFVPIQPVETDLITLAVGQRAEVIVEAVGSPTGSYWFRSTLGSGQGACSLPDGISPDAMAVVYYEDAGPNTVPTTTSSIDTSRIFTCANDPLAGTVPLFPISSDVQGDILTQEFHIDFTNNGTNFLWTVNNVSARVDYGVSQLAEAVKGTLSPKLEWNVYNLGTAKTLRIIMYNSFVPVGHPMHMHGHNFQVLAEGYGDWDGTITNPSNPMRRDVQFLQTAKPDGTRAFTVLQVELDNPTINIFHCHLAWHVSGGLYVALLERPDLITGLTIPDSVTDTCTKWNAFTQKVVPDQIDSGI